MKIFKCILKVAAFLILFAVVFNAVSMPLLLSNVAAVNKDYQWMSGIYEERKDSLDAVYIGSSNCYAFWIPAMAWERSGIAVLTYACSSQPLLAAEYLVREARKTQSDALYIINTNTLGDLEGELDDVVLHRLLDYMPLSVNKLQFADHVLDIAGFSFTERLEYYFPIIRYHDKWESLTAENFEFDLNTVKGSDTRKNFLGKIYDVSSEYYITDECTPVTDVLADSVTSLLDYLEKEEVNVLFVTVPRAEKTAGEPERINTVNKMIAERGFALLDLREDFEDIGLDLTVDYYNVNHTNIHGAIKYTYYLSDYLIENYGFEDKRGDPDYADWDQAAQDYADITKNRMLPVERLWEQRAYDIQSPVIQSMKPVGDTIELVWSASAGADGYSVYRKVDDVEWVWLGDHTETVYTDSEAVASGKYVYTVVPYRLKDGERYYGKFNYWGRAVEKK